MTAALAALGFIFLLLTSLLILAAADYERCQQRRRCRENLRMYADYYQGSAVRRTTPESSQDGGTSVLRGGGR